MDEEKKKNKKKKVVIDKNVCIKCGSCALLYPDAFEILDDGVVTEKEEQIITDEEAKEVINTCPVGAISLVKDTD